MAVTMTCLWRLAMGSVMVLATVVMGQDGMEDMTDMDSMMAAPSGGDGGGGGATHKKEKELTVIQQTTLALQQLGIVIGVAFMVAFLFMVMIGIEKLWEKMEENWQSMRGKAPPKEVDPASLVGTFSRYKN